MISISLAVAWVASALILELFFLLFLGSLKKKSQDRDNDLFRFKLEHLLKNETKTVDFRLEEARKLCHDTKGDLSAGAYLVMREMFPIADFNTGSFRDKLREKESASK